MDEIERLLDANRRYAASPPEPLAAPPARRIAVVTCMDARIDVLAALGLRIGDAHVLRNAGGRVTADVLRSLALSAHVLGVDTVVVMEHTGCGLAGATDEQLRERTGADVEFLPIRDHAEAVAQDVDAVLATPYLSPVRAVAGFVYDVATGALTEVARRQRPA